MMSEFFREARIVEHTTIKTKFDVGCTCVVVSDFQEMLPHSLCMSRPTIRRSWRNACGWDPPTMRYMGFAFVIVRVVSSMLYGL